jgi:hypothetical protein
MGSMLVLVETADLGRRPHLQPVVFVVVVMVV